MKSIRFAAFFAAASIVLLTACATDSSPTASSSDRSNPCLGVAPAVGTSLVRKEDCGVRPQQSAGPSGQSKTDIKKQ